MKLNSFKSLISCNKSQLYLPQDLGLLSRLSLLYLAQGRLALLRGNLQIGLDFFNKANECNSTNSQLLYDQAIYLVEYGYSYEEKVGHKKRLGWLTACKKFQSAVDLSPSFFEAWHRLGKVLLLLGGFYSREDYYLAAQECLTTALHLQKEQNKETVAELYWDYGLAWFYIGSYSGEGSNFYRALKPFSNAVSLKVKLPSLFWKDFGQLYWKVAKQACDPISALKGAVYCFKEAVILKPSGWEEWFFLACAAAELYHFDWEKAHFIQADNCFSTADYLSPKNRKIVHEWAKFLLESGKQSREFKKLQSALEKSRYLLTFDSLNLGGISIQAQALAILGEVTDSVQLISEAQRQISQLRLKEGVHDLEVMSSSAQILLSFARHFQDLDYYYQAAEKYQEIISLDRTQYRAWYSMAEIWTVIGDQQNDLNSLETALRFYKKGLYLKPLSFHYVGYATALFRIGEMKRDRSYVCEAISYLQHLLQLNKHPHFSNILFKYAVALNILGDLDEEETHYRKALESLSQLMMTDPSFPAIHYHMALSYSQLGDLLQNPDYFYNAIHHYRLQLQYDESHDASLLDWGIALIHLAEASPTREVAEGHYKEAELKFMQAAQLGNEEVFYQLACYYSMIHSFERSIFFLAKGFQVHSLPDIEDILNDEWLDPLRDTAMFQNLLPYLYGRDKK